MHDQEEGIRLLDQKVEALQRILRFVFVSRATPTTMARMIQHGAEPAPRRRVNRYSPSAVSTAQSPDRSYGEESRLPDRDEAAVQEPS